MKIVFKLLKCCIFLFKILMRELVVVIKKYMVELKFSFINWLEDICKFNVMFLRLGSRWVENWFWGS